MPTATQDCVLVLLHGRGGVRSDLDWLQESIPRPWTSLLWQGSLAHGSGFEWFHVPAGVELAPSSKHVADAADDLVASIDRDLAGARVGLVGFSQGGALAVQALRRHPHRIHLVATFAGFMTVDPERGDAELARLRPPLLWVRGARDDVIPRSDIDRMHSFLPGHTNLQERVHPHSGHEITASMADDMSRFLSGAATQDS